MILKIFMTTIISIFIMGCSTKSLAQQEHEATMKEIVNLKPVANELKKRGARLDKETSATIKSPIMGK